MSRGLGLSQRRVLAVLSEVPTNDGLPVAELKDQVGANRPNVRRAVRTLATRGLVEEVTVESPRLVRITFMGRLKAVPPLPKEPDPLAELRVRWKEKERVLREARAAKRRRLEEKAAEGHKCTGYEHRPVRRRRPGATQQTILTLLWKFADPLDSGLPILAVKAIVRDNLSTDRSNIRRAIRTLLRRREIEESEDGEHIRLTSKTAIWFSFFPPISPKPIGEEQARAILRTFRNSQVVT